MGTVSDSSGQGESKAFLGGGMAFPMRTDSDGQIMMNSMEDHVRQSILMIMDTMQGERIMQPDFGGGLDTLVFAPNSSSTIALAEYTIRTALRDWEPRIDIDQLTVTIDPQQPEKMEIYLRYRVRQSDTMFNLVYPFYLERGQL